MSSHREAPEITKDPVADNTDLYAFVSPDKPDTVTIITNYIPLEGPAGGPNFFEFGDDVLYSIYIDNDGDAKPDIIYQFRFETRLRNPNTFLYNTGPIGSLERSELEPAAVLRGHAQAIGTARKTHRFSDLASPPCNIGPRSTPNYPSAGAGGGAPPADRRDGVRRPAQRRVLRRPRVDLRPRRPAPVPEPAPDPDPGSGGRRSARTTLNVHTIAIQVPITQLTRDGSKPTDPTSAKAVLGIWGAASRRRVKVHRRRPTTRTRRVGSVGAGLAARQPALQRGGRPARQEGPAGTRTQPSRRQGSSRQYVKQPELAKLLPVLYPGVFPNLAGLTADRADLVAILLTGHPVRDRARASRTTRARRSPTCCA